MFFRGVVCVLGGCVCVFFWVVVCVCVFWVVVCVFFFGWLCVCV